MSGGRPEWTATSEEENAARTALDAWIVALTTADCDAAQAAMTLDFAMRNDFALETGWDDCAGLAEHVRERDQASCDFRIEASSDVAYHTRVDAHLGEILVTTTEVCDGERVIELHLVPVDGDGWRVNDVLDEVTER